MLLPIRFQGQPSSGDRLPLYPRCSPDINQRLTRGQRTRPCHLLVGLLAAVQADVCLRCGQTHVSLSDVVGPHRCKSLLFLFRYIRTFIFINSLIFTVPTALTYHYETQCIPTPLAWFAHQLPVWWQKLSVIGTFATEIPVPLLFFSPVRRLRIGSFYLQVGGNPGVLSKNVTWQLCFSQFIFCILDLFCRFCFKFSSFCRVTTISSTSWLWPSVCHFWMINTSTSGCARDPSAARVVGTKMTRFLSSRLSCNQPVFPLTSHSFMSLFRLCFLLVAPLPAGAARLVSPDCGINCLLRHEAGYD